MSIKVDMARLALGQSPSGGGFITMFTWWVAEELQNW
jgi:hypothetical protein